VNKKAPMKTLQTLITEFDNAYAKVDPESFASCVSAEFEWRQHSGPLPLGKTISGIDAVCEEIRWRKKNWKKVQYINQIDHFAENMIISSFEVSGTDENGHDFRVNAVDLYPVENNKIVRKDTYWKYS
jgi:hypothetical protein